MRIEQIIPQTHFSTTDSFKIFILLLEGVFDFQCVLLRFFLSLRLSLLNSVVSIDQVCSSLFFCLLFFWCTQRCFRSLTICAFVNVKKGTKTKANHLDSLKQAIVHLKQSKKRTGKRTWTIKGSTLCYNMCTYKYTMIKSCMVWVETFNWPQQKKTKFTVF